MSRTATLFVGNIPYEATEGQLTELFSQIGSFVSFRLVYRDNGKSKGYGFCDYRDGASALVSMRRFNGYEINGRSLRVDFADEKSGMERDRGEDARYQISRNSLQQGALLGSGNGNSGSVGLQSDIGKVLESMTTSQLYEIMVQLKGLSQENPERARYLLINNPQFAYALLKTQVLLGMITPDISKQLISTASVPGMGTPLSNVQPPLLAPPVTILPPQVPVPQPSIAPGPIGFGFPLGYQMPLQSFQMGLLPSLAMQPIPGINQPIPTPLATDPLVGVLGEDQRQLLEQVMQLTPEQIEKLQPQERQQIMQLRQTMMSLNWGLPR